MNYRKVQQNQSLEEQVKKYRLNNDLLKVQSEVRRLGKKVESFRLLKGVLESEMNQEYLPFTEVEYCLSFAAFTSWMYYCFGEKERGNDYPFSQPNVSARQIALDFTNKYLTNPNMIRIIRKHIPTFDPQREITLCSLKSKSAEWSICLTRAIILICRKLAYAFVGYDNDRIEFPQITTRVLPTMSRDWVKEVLGEEAAGYVLYDYEVI